MKTWEEFLKNILLSLKDENKLNRNDLIEKVSTLSNLTEAEKNEKLANGTARYRNRIDWAIAYLRSANLLVSPERGYYQITQEGIKLNNSKNEINKDDLSVYPGYIEFINKKGTKKTKNNKINIDESKQTDDEYISDIIGNNKKQIISDLLTKIQKMNPYAFEKLCVKLISSIYHIADSRLGITTKKSGDGGIDGIVNFDALGLNKVYIQAKRFENNITSKLIRDFVGAVTDAKAKNSIFITTSDFDEKAKNTAKNNSIILINGREFVELMLENKLGVEPKMKVELYKISEDFFEDLEE